ncbi:MAG: CHAT domain-containing protein, partial [Planctomycetota bacterium]
LADKAIEEWQAAPGRNHIQILRALDNLVECGLSKHDLIRCEQASEQRFEILNSLREPLSTAETEQMVEALNDKGRLRVLQTRFDEALEEFNRALDLITDEIVGGPGLRAALTGNIGWLFSFQGKYTEAEEYITRALELFRVAFHPKHRTVETSFDFLCNLARQQGDYARANQLADSALSLAREIYGTSHPSLSGTYQMKARLLVALDSAGAAVEYAERAVAVNREATDYPTNLFMGSLETTGNVALAAGQFDLADRNFSEFLAARRSFLKTVFGYASESHKLAYLEQYPPIIFTLLSTAVENPRPSTRRVAMDMVLNGKGFAIDALASEKAAAVCSENPILDSLLMEHRITCTEIARLALSRRSGEEDVLRKLDDLYSEKNRIEIDLSQMCSNLDFIRDAGSVSSSALASTLPGNSVLWEFVKYKRIDPDILYQKKSSMGEFYVAITLASDDDLAFIDLGVASLIDSLIEEYRSEMSDALQKQLAGQAVASTDWLKQVSTELYRRLIAPLENTLHSAGEVYVAADGAINLLPFETLTKDGERYLIEDHQFVYLTSGRNLLKEKTDSDSRDAIVMADPDYMVDPSTLPAFADMESSQFYASRGNIDAPECLGSLFSPLPMTRREGLSITQLLEQTDIMDVSFFESGEAREGTLKNLQQAPRILHIATHGYFCEQVQNDLMSNPLSLTKLVWIPRTAFSRLWRFPV